MASPQPATSSPTRSAASPDRFDLSPQSRLRKLLATVDSDSDEDVPKLPARKARLPRLASPSLVQGDDMSNDDDEEEEAIVRPRGRLAARMQGGALEDVKDATRRVGKSVGGEDVNTQDHHASSKTAGIEDDAENGDEDEDMPVRSRQLKLRNRQSSTPEPSDPTPRAETSPGLFVTPSKPPPSGQENPVGDSASDSDLPPLKSDRFKALVERKRKERLAREAEEVRKKEARAAAALEQLGDDNDDDVSDITDDEGGRKLTQGQQSRPSRKASKKAIEEMNRETQRMQRAMQLAHEAKTKKKIAKSSLFERFNFNPSGNVPAKESSSRPQTPTSTKSTDAEMLDAGTPPSSPPARAEDVLGKDLESAQTQQTTVFSERLERGDDDDDADLVDIMDITAFARKPLDTFRAQGSSPSRQAQTPLKAAAPKRQFRVKISSIQANQVALGSDNEDELMIINKKSKLDAVFDRIPTGKARESKSLRLLRQLAHLDSPERKTHKKTDKAAMTPGELQAHLQQRAREQAKLERERRLEMLKAKGIHIQTEEERERDREQIEDMVARARREAEEIMHREREEAKKEKRAKGDDPLAWDDSASDDDDYEAEASEAGDKDENDIDIELSGSEEEEDNTEGMVVDGDDDDEEQVEEEEAAGPEAEDTAENSSAVHNLIDDAADEDAESEGSASESEKSWVDPDEEEEKHRWGAEDEDGMDEAPAFAQARRPKVSLAVKSDDDHLEIEATPKPLKSHAINFTPKPIATQAVTFTPRPNTHTSPEVPTSVLRSAAKTFIPGLPVDNGEPAGLRLTQIFAGTMDDSQTGPMVSPSQPMPTFDNFPDSQFSQNDSATSDAMILDSQDVPATQRETQGSEKESQIQLDFTQSQTHGLDSLLRDDLGSQPSQLIIPTQDGGFQDWTPLKERFVEQPVSTISTVAHDTSPIKDMSHESPLLQKRGRLRRKAVIASDSEDDEDDYDAASKPTAFNVMKDAAAREKKQKKRDEFDRKKSRAKEMVQEQAEESEDEYAGLGGVDGEDSDDDDLASVHEMIDDQTQGNQLEELKIAALHAERERAEDAKQTDKLFHDITRGMLRRKRGADYDLSDSDDGGEARRRMKRRQFAKMQKALFTDERISKVAENPRNQAFMRTIEDIGSDEEMDFLFEIQPGAGNNETQLSNSTTGAMSQEQQTVVPDSQPTEATAAGAQRRPAAERRTKASRRPASLGEIRETLSNLLDEPSSNTVITATDFGSDSEGHAEDSNDEGSTSNKENSNPSSRRRRHTGAGVVDRISLKRQGSSTVSTGSTGVGRMAFAAPASTAANGGFRVPTLLRKATANSLMSTASTASSGPSAGAAGNGSGFGEGGKIKKNAGKRSGISYIARETDRRAKLVEVERRREEKKFKAVKGRGKVVGGLFGAGKFE